MKLLNELYPYKMAPISPDTDEVVRLLQKELPFDVHEYPNGMEHNGWVVPDNWYVEKALIKKDGLIIYNGMEQALGVIGYSQSYNGVLTLDELKEHLFYSRKFDDALIYHCDLYYKVGQSNWGFSMPKQMIEQLEDGEYTVELDTVFAKGTLKVLDYFIQGQTDDTIVINAHNCHSGQANDDIAGVVLGVELMKYFQKTQHYYSYRLIICPEHFGTICYLSNIDDRTFDTFKYGIFLEMVGNDNRIALQKTFTGTSEIDQIIEHYLMHQKEESFIDDFRKIIGNDETVWESAGFELPTVSISRFPYDEYHTSRDTIDIISDEKMNESFEHMKKILWMLDNNVKIKRKFRGLIALSNPKYDLYISNFDPSIRPEIDDAQKKWNYLMDCIPRYFDENMTILEISKKHGLYFEDVYNYVKKFEEKDLVELISK